MAMIHRMNERWGSAGRLAGVAVFLATVSFSLGGLAQAPYDVKASYVKREVFIPMRDGVKLFTIIY